MVDIEEVIMMAEMEGCPECGSEDYECDGDEMVCNDCGYTLSVYNLLA